MCGSIMPYDGLSDGLSDGLFAVTKSHIFTRELLEVWVFDVCRIGMTFREAIMSWKDKA